TRKKADAGLPSICREAGIVVHRPEVCGSPMPFPAGLLCRVAGTRLQLAEALDRLDGAEILQFVKLADLDLGLAAFPGRVRKPLAPLQRLLPRRHLNERVA